MLFADAGRSEAWWFLGAKVTNLNAVLEVPGFHVAADGSIVADSRIGPDELRSDR